MEDVAGGGGPSWVFVFRPHFTSSFCFGWRVDGRLSKWKWRVRPSPEHKRTRTETANSVKDTTPRGKCWASPSDAEKDPKKERWRSRLPIYHRHCRRGGEISHPFGWSLSSQSVINELIVWSVTKSQCQRRKWKVQVQWCVDVKPCPWSLIVASLILQGIGLDLMYPQRKRGGVGFWSAGENCSRFVQIFHYINAVQWTDRIGRGSR